MPSLRPRRARILGAMVLGCLLLFAPSCVSSHLGASDAGPDAVTTYAVHCGSGGHVCGPDQLCLERVGGLDAGPDAAHGPHQECATVSSTCRTFDCETLACAVAGSCACELCHLWSPAGDLRSCAVAIVSVRAGVVTCMWP